MKTRNGYTNDSDFVSSEFIKENSEIAIPYLAIISAFTLSGCVGNIMVIGAILVYKVSRLKSHISPLLHFMFPTT